MTKPFFERLKRYFSAVAEVLRGEADAASIFPNTTDIGIARECIYAEVLRKHLPSSCNVFLGGFLFDQNGNESDQIDIIVTNGSSLQFSLHTDGPGKAFACVDGCVAVVSVKSMLDSAGLVDALENIASIPDKQPFETLPQIIIPFYEDWPYKVIYASNGIQLPNLLQSVHKFYDEHQDIPVHKRPHLIHVAGKYVIARIANKGEQTRGGTVLAPSSFHPIADTTDVLALLKAITSIQGIVVASKYVMCEYKSMIDNIPF